MATARLFKGFVIERGDGVGTEVFAAVTNVESVTLSSIASPDVDVTKLSSTYAEKLRGVPELGPASFVIQFDAADSVHKLLVADSIDRASHNFKIKFSDHATTPSVIAFPAYVSIEFSGGAVNDKNLATVTLTPTGASYTTTWVS